MNCMRNVDSNELFTATEEIEVDTKTSAAIARGLRDAGKGRVTPSEKVRELVQQWISNFPFTYYM